jgi:DUF4097 and DUF4098 domain-containing protein YvlB
MRLRSFVGPLILIVIGGLFLINNLKPELPMLEIITRWWPFLLIGWGALRLVEILVLAATSKPLPRAGITGGEWVLILFLFLVGSGLIVVRRYGPSFPHGRVTLRGVEMFGEPYDYPLSAQKQVGKAPRVIVENLRGNVRITGADSEEVKVTGTKTIRSFSRSEADGFDKQTPLDVSVQGDQLIIRTNQEKASENRHMRTDLELVVPKGASIEGRGRSGDYDVTNIAGEVQLTGEEAGLRAQDIGGNMRVELRRGNAIRIVNCKGAVELRGRGGDVDLESIEGPVTVNASFYGELTFRKLAKPLRFESTQSNLRIEKVQGILRLTPGNLEGNDLVGPMVLTTRSKDVELNDFSQPLELSVENGDISLRPGRLPLSRMDVRTKSGHIDVSLPASAKFQVKAKTERGEVDNGFGAPLKAVEENRGAVVSGSTGEGPELTFTTNRGNVSLRKGAAAGEKQTAIPPAQQPLKVTSQ